MSEAANQLMTLVEATETLLDGIAEMRVNVMIRKLATQIIAGEYPTLKNVLVEEKDQYADIEFDNCYNIAFDEEN